MMVSPRLPRIFLLIIFSAGNYDIQLSYFGWYNVRNAGEEGQV